MAQWIARRTSNPEAVGSSPTVDVFFCFSLIILYFEMNSDSSIRDFLCGAAIGTALTMSACYFLRPDYPSRKFKKEDKLI